MLALLVAACAVLVCELAYRQVKRSRYQSVAAAWDHELFAMRPDRDYVHTMLPSRTRTNEIPGHDARWTYTINSLGLRGPEPRAEEPGLRRVLTLGDSFTFGWAVDDDEAYPRILETLLNADVGAPPVEVINAGTPGYNTHQQAAFLHARQRANVTLLKSRVAELPPQETNVAPKNDNSFTYSLTFQWVFANERRQRSLLRGAA